MSEVIFHFDGTEYKVNCKTNEPMETIIDKFQINNGLNDNNNIFYLYNGTKMNNKKLTFIEQANDSDKDSKIMNIVVIMNEDVQRNNKVISKDIICPICKEIVLISINDFKIDLSGCKCKQNLNNLSLFEYEETQKIDLIKIKCGQCNSSNKFEAYENQFFYCFTCNKNLCSICKNQHDKNHLIINEDDKNYICKYHGEPFCKYCKTCKENICVICEKMHLHHELIDLGKIMPNKERLLTNNKEIKNIFVIFKYRINILIGMLNKMLKIIETYDLISTNLIKNFNERKRNYNSFKNLFYLKNYNEKIVKDLNNITNDYKLYNIYEYAFNYFYNENGEKYSGEMKNGLKDGKGILYYSKDLEINEKIYEGDWKNDKREGKGIMFWKNGETYRGEWKNDKRDGKGKMNYKNGETYEGNWKNDKYEGYGIKNYKNGDKYEGYWKNNKYYGKGLKYYNNGERYDGDWINDIKEGKGKYFYKNGEKYEGEWKNDKFNGSGVYYYKNGEKYSGQWIDNIYNGRGFYHYENGDEYEGDWKNGKREGKGIIQYKNGFRYFGDWKNDIKLGKCLIHYSNKDQYDGDWKNEEKNGYGEYYYNDGGSYKGYWKDGKRNGNGIMLWKNGDKYEGGWKDDKREGNGKMYYAQAGEYYDGEWNNDKRDGKGTLTLRNGKKKTGPWKDDEFKGIDLLKSFSKIFK